MGSVCLGAAIVARARKEMKNGEGLRLQHFQPQLKMRLTALSFRDFLAIRPQRRGRCSCGAGLFVDNAGTTGIDGPVYSVSPPAP